MTAEVAHRILHPETSREAIIEMEYYAGLNKDKVIEKINEASVMACEALEKQIPMKPYAESDGDADGYPVWDYYCPFCNEFFDGYEPSHCWKCGQAILWGEGD